MPILQQRDQNTVRERFDLELKGDVTITLFTQGAMGGLFIPGRECKTCGTTQELLEEVSALSPKLHLEVVDFYGSPQQAEAEGVEKIPAIIVQGNGRSNVRLYGLPVGMEFAVLLDTIIASSSKRSTLELETRRRLRRLQQDVHIQVFVTPN